ncbi:TadE/TadG family type IV pilus assembly protein [Parvularcula marina]|uniref:TadE/TadG family type IV pilus assembly protein n=1 Tax=Parvularcula marina TaxID=2292771 RepID=UPI003519CC02
MRIADVMKGLHRRFRRDGRGTAATEFALILPVLITAYFGSISAFEGFQARKSVTKASTTVVDLITRSQVMNTTLRDNMYDVARALVGDAADEGTTVTMTSISNPVSESDPDARVIDWSYSNDFTTVIEEDDLEDMNLPIIPKGDSLIVARVYIEHTPRFDFGMFDKQQMSQLTFRRPRFVLRIPSTI